MASMKINIKSTDHTGTSMLTVLTRLQNEGVPIPFRTWVGASGIKSYEDFINDLRSGLNSYMDELKSKPCVMVMPAGSMYLNLEVIR